MKTRTRTDRFGATDPRNRDASPIGVAAICVGLLSTGVAVAQTACPPGDVFVGNAGSYPAGSSAQRLLTADTNGDGNDDIVVLSNNSGTYSVGVLLGAGDGTLGPLLTSSALDFAGGLFIDFETGDLNADGLDDVAVAQTSFVDEHVLVYFANADGTLQPPVIAPASRSRAVEIRDWNKDGVNDIVSGSLDLQNGLSVVLSNGDGTFQPEQTSPVDIGFNDIVVADFTNDGRLDVATQRGTVVVAFSATGQGSLNFGTASPSDFSTQRRMRAADLNRDGGADIVGLSIGGNPLVSTLSGIATFEPVAAPAGGSGGQATAMDVADLDGDGYPDLAVVRDSGVLQFYKGNGDGTFQPPVEDTLPGTPSSVTLGDFDATGTLDAAVLVGSDVVLYTSNCQIAPVIGMQPKSLTANAGSAIELRIDMALGSLPLMFQWRRDGVPLNDSATTTGVNTPQLSLSQASAGDIGLYDVVVTNSLGSAVSQAAVVSVVPALPACPGDYNRDGVADNTDILEFLADAEDCP